MFSVVEADRVNGLSSVVRMTRGTMQEASVVDGGGVGVLVGSAGAELTSLVTVRRKEARTTMLIFICIS